MENRDKEAVVMKSLIKELKAKLVFLNKNKNYETLLLKNENKPYCVYEFQTFVEVTPELKKKLLHICGLIEGIAVFDYRKSSTNAKGEFGFEKEYLNLGMITEILDNSFSSHEIWYCIESNIEKLINILKKEK